MLVDWSEGIGHISCAAVHAEKGVSVQAVGGLEILVGWLELGCLVWFRVYHWLVVDFLVG